MSERTVTLEFTVQAGVQHDDEGLHARGVVGDHLDALPLCWVAEGKQRGATVEEWEVAFDHESLPTFALVDAEAFVTCADCKEWLHA